VTSGPVKQDSARPVKATRSQAVGFSLNTLTMANPTQKHTKSRKRKRRAVIKLKPVSLTVCPKCKRPLKPHTACAFCGTYNGKEVLKIRLKKKERKERKKEEKELEKQEKKKK